MLLEKLEEGLWLPNRRILIPWGGDYNSLKSSASDSRDWLPHDGGDVRYGQLHWEDELLIPGGYYYAKSGKVIAYVKGKSPTVRRFELQFYGEGYYKRESFKYGVWMNSLTKYLGPPSIDTESLSDEDLLAPPLIWQAGKVTITCYHQILKDSESSGVYLTHQDHIL